MNPRAVLSRLAALLLLATVPAFAGTTNAFQHRGFTVDDSAIGASTNLAAVRSALKVQIDIVCDVGLPAAVLKDLQAVPLQIMPRKDWNVPTPGRYLGPKKGVQMGEGFVRQGNKPILLHELMHHYHSAIMPDGTRNADLLGFFQKAKALPAYDAKSHMMSNVGEYFACTTTTYLFGVTAQEPFQRAKVKEQQPEYHDYLKKLFGPEAGSHVGVLKAK